MDGILQYLQHHGQRLDSEIAAAMGMEIEKVRVAISDLSADGDVLVCRSIQFKEGKPVEAMLCRVSGYIPPASPGRKPKQ
jgi:hypothetical protein